ncbi:BREX-2 system phosphatase PglZ [bacterium endosymbiont of Escarpia laminata]|nr:MAG: BREX-2 system phosphatase PglZ [bacterium endosymbiont of Escarpia laminata]
MAESVIPGPVKAQLQAILTQDAKADRIALVWHEPIDPVESEGEIANIRLRLVYCSSELSIRERLVLHKTGDQRLVMLSPFDETRLAKDVLARLWRNEPHRISPWRTLEQLLRVGQIDPRLTGKEYRWIAECLVSSYDRYRTHINFGEVLDFDKAWEALALGLLGYREPSLDLDSLLNWSLNSGVSDTVAALPKEVSDHLSDWLKPRLDKLTLLVETLWAQGHAGDMLAVGLVCSLLYGEGAGQTQEIFQARGSFTERFLGGAKLDSSVLRSFGDAATAFAGQALQRGNQAGINAALTHAEQVLASLDLMSLAAESDLLPAAFGLRLDQFANCLKQSIGGKPVQSTLAALAALQCHQLAKVRKDQVRTAELAVRTCVWLQTDVPEKLSAATIIRGYVAEGGYIDWARSRIWSGDEHEAVSNAYQQLTKKVTTRREALNQDFSHHLPAVARGDQLGNGIWPVESVLDALVVPLAKPKQQQVLLLVLDGMSQAVFRELSDDLIRNHWVELQRGGSQGPECLLSALPSITRISRYSLLAGVLGEGTSADEKKAFASHQGLKSLASTKFPPVLFHKADLQQTGSGALASGVREVIAGREHRIVGAVINAVDDQLSSNAQLSVNWSVESVSLLRQILEAARESGRLVIFTSDHGHVLDHDMKYTKSPSEAERFKVATEKAGAGELLIEGGRVVQPGHKAILPWSEKIRYASKKMGYHGGGSLQELIIPFGLFRNAGETNEIEGWHEVPRQEPSWWRLDTATLGAAEATLGFQQKPKRKEKQDKHTQDLFDQPVESAAPQGDATDWINDLFASPVYAQMKTRVGRVIIRDEQIKTLLRFLGERDGQQMVAATVQVLGIPAIRINGFLVGVQKLLNVDGYPVLSVDRATKTVKLNIESLKTQFEL